MNGGGAFIVEVVLTFLIVLVVLLVTQGDTAPGLAGLAIGFALAVVHFVGIPPTAPLRLVPPVASLGAGTAEGL